MTGKSADEPPSASPGLPAWIAFAIPQREKPPPDDSPAQVRSRRVSCVSVLLLFAFLLLCVRLGWAALASGSRLPLWVVLAHLPYLWSVHGTRRFFRQRVRRLQEKPQLTLGTLDIVGYEPAQVRANALYRDEDLHWEWDHFTALEFVGESGGRYVVRLQERPDPPAPSDKTMPPLVVRLAKMARFFGWHKSSFFLAACVPPVATALLTVFAFVRAPWSLAFGFALCILALHVAGFLFFFGTSRKEPETPRSDAPEYIYLLFDSREVTAQEAMGRLSRYIEGGAASA